MNSGSFFGVMVASQRENVEKQLRFGYRNGSVGGMAVCGRCPVWSAPIGMLSTTSSCDLGGTFYWVLHSLWGDRVFQIQLSK